MKYAKIKNGKITDVINGLAPSDYVEVIQKWEAPTDYPISFYITNSNKPIVSIVGDEVHENWGFTLKSVDAIKGEIYKKLAANRWEKENAGFDFNGQTIPATATAQVKIPEMPETVSSFKVADGVFITLADTQPLKDALVTHIQSLYEWENLECATVSECLTHDELKQYLEG